MLTGNGTDYHTRLEVERDTFADQERVHGTLPPAAHRWSHRHMLPKLQALGVSSIDELIMRQIAQRAESAERDVVVLSLGSGNGDQELEWLTSLAERGVHNVRLRLLEFNSDMQQRAAASAHELGVPARVEHVDADFNRWKADGEHDVVVGFQALHHVLDLEHLYSEIQSGLRTDGVLVVHDMIGRNGHRRWPEALEVVERIWSTLPDELRRNAVTGEIDAYYEDRDCAVEGFEGIRAQDVLPKLLERFHPSLFLGVGNVIDPFIDRIYGHNFDMDKEHHRELIDHIGTLDDALVDLGVVTPTRLTALFHPTPRPLRVFGNRTPERSVRDTDIIDTAARISFQPQASDKGGVVSGAGFACGRMNGIAHDNWAAPSVEIPVFATQSACGATVRTYVPDWMPRTGKLTVLADGVAAGTVEIGHGLTEQVVSVEVAARQATLLVLQADWSVNPHQAGLGSDRRILSYVLAGLELH